MNLFAYYVILKAKTHVLHFLCAGEEPKRNESTTTAATQGALSLLSEISTGTFHSLFHSQQQCHCTATSRQHGEQLSRTQGPLAVPRSPWKSCKALQKQHFGVICQTWEQWLRVTAGKVPAWQRVVRTRSKLLLQTPSQIHLYLPHSASSLLSQQITLQVGNHFLRPLINGGHTNAIWFPPMLLCCSHWWGQASYHLQ